MRKPAFVTLVVFLFSVVLSAQTVDELIAKNIAAHGGLAKLKAINSMRVTGHFEVGTAQAQFVQVRKRPDKLRLDATIQDFNLVQAFDGLNGWQINPFSGKSGVQPMTPEEVKAVKEQSDIDGPLVDYKQKGHSIELVGKEKVDGADTYNLKLTLKDGDVRNVYLSATTFLEVRSVYKIIIQGAAVVQETTVGDYRNTDGIMFAYAIERRSQGTTEGGQKITIEKVEFDVPVEDSVFKMPEPEQPKPAPTTDDRLAPSQAPAGNKPPLE
jgi:outer membrane lipoprotein-sorting protein